MSSGVPELCLPHFRAPRFVAVCPQKPTDRLRIKNVTVQAAILTQEVVEVNFNGLSGETVSLDWKYLAIDSSVPGLHSRTRRVGVEFGGRNVTIGPADLETGSERQQQCLLKLIRQTIPIGIDPSAVPEVKCEEANYEHAQSVRESVEKCVVKA